MVILRKPGSVSFGGSVMATPFCWNSPHQASTAATSALNFAAQHIYFYCSKIIFMAG